MTTDSNSAPAIHCRNLWMVFGDRARERYQALSGGAASPAELADALAQHDLVSAVRDVNFDVANGELFVIMGLSGSGKSTVVRCLSRIIEPTAGTVHVGGQDVLAADRKTLIDLRRHTMGMVFQHFGLFPNMTVMENVGFPLKVQGISAGERRARAEEVISLVGLEGKEERFPRELSGGQQQRVGIARSLAVNPSVWFLDEPFSALDPLIRRQLQDEFLNLQSTLLKSIVFITHDFSEAMRIADRIAIMRDGEIVQVGTPAEIVLEPADDYVASFARDIPRARVMRVESLMEPCEARPAPAEGLSLSAAMPLEEALVRCASGINRVPVLDGGGRVVGELTPERIASAFAEASAAANTESAPVES